MTTHSEKSGVPGIVKIVIGLVLMFGGYWFSENVHLAFQESLAKQGIPLDIGMTFSAIGVFLVLMPLLKKFYFDPLGEAIGSRSAELEKTFSEAEALRAEMASLKADYEQRLAKTEADAREKIQAEIHAAQEMRKQLMVEASAKADEFLKKAQEDISLERDKVLKDLRVQVVNLTLQATERILGDNIDDARNRKLVQDFIERAEVPS